MHAIETTNLTKRFGDTIVLNNVSLAVKTGEIFGLLGPNGAGKTTLMSILSTIMSPDSGEACICGYDVIKEASKVRERICAVTQFSGADLLFSGWDNLEFLAKIFGVPRCERKIKVRRSLAAVGLAEEAKKIVMNYSGGMKKRLALAKILFRSFEVLLLDEPTSGIDPMGKRNFWEQIIKVNKKNKTTAFLATHDTFEAERYCNRVAIMDKGKIVTIGSPDELKKMIKAGNVIEVITEGLISEVLNDVKKLSGVVEAKMVATSLNARPNVYVFAGQIPKEYQYVKKEKDAVIIKIPTEVAIKMSNKELKEYAEKLRRDARESYRARVGIKSAIRIFVDDYKLTLPNVLSLLTSKGVKICSIRIDEPSLEDVFIYYTGRKME